MRTLRDDDGESGGFELIGLLAVMVATAIAFFVYSDNSGDTVAHVRFIDPVHAGAPSEGGEVSGETTTAITTGKVTLPAMAPAPHERPARHVQRP